MWDPVDKKVFHSRDIIFMESEKKINNSDEIRTHPIESRLTLEEPAGHGDDIEPVAEEVEEAEIGTDQDPNQIRMKKKYWSRLPKAKEGVKSLGN